MYENLLIVVTFLPLLGCLFIAAARNGESQTNFNALYVAVLTVVTIIILLLVEFSLIKNMPEVNDLEVWQWEIEPEVKIAQKADMFSLLLILAVNFVVLVGIVGLRSFNTNRKSVLFFSMMFLSFVNGYFTAADVVSFYVFFVLMGFPLMMQLGIAEKKQKSYVVMRFFVRQCFASLLFLVALTGFVAQNPESYALTYFSGADFMHPQKMWILACVFMALVLRLPLFSERKIMANVTNPLVFININILPITGIYGLVRFWPDTFVKEVSFMIPIFGVLCLIVMLFSAINNRKSPSLSEKLYGYTVVYNLLYLCAVFLPTNILQINIGYSLFSFLILVSLLAVNIFHVNQERAKFANMSGGILCLLPRTSFIYAISVLAAVGLPITALFWNNFIILSRIFDYSLLAGAVVMLSLTVLAVSMINNLYNLKNRACLVAGTEKAIDIDKTQFFVYMAIMAVLFLSFIKPLWFVL